MPIDSEGLYAIVYIEEDLSATKQPYLKRCDAEVSLIVRETGWHLVKSNQA
jgi:hypothetical protein